GVISRTIYDLATGRTTQRIEDVDTTVTTDEPGGWSTPGGTGFGNHLVFDYTYDDQGRLVQTLGPSHDSIVSGTSTTLRAANWTVYIENAPHEQDEVWSGGGYATGTDPSYTYVLVDPVSIQTQGKGGSSKGGT